MAVLIGLILIVTFAMIIMAMVALPRLRSGEDLLTTEGRQTIARVGEKTRESSASAAGNTVSAVTSLRERVSTAWAPASDFLHQQIDRLEGDGETGDPWPAESGVQEGGFATGDGPDPKTVVRDGGPEIGRPRPVPAISGPIPEIGEPVTDQQAGRAADQHADQHADQPGSRRR